MRGLVVALWSLSMVTTSLAAGEAGRGADWAALTPEQRASLGPLQRDWPSIDENRRRKWIELVSRFPSMPADERMRVQQRMAEWARMTSAERASARLQFQQFQVLPASERQARWQAYQALPEAERKELAQKAKPAAPAASDAEAQIRNRAATGATAGNAKRNLVLPTSAQGLGRAVAPAVVQAKPGATTTTMSTRGAVPPAHHQAGLPKIAATAGFVDPATLLPQRGPQGAAVRSATSTEPVRQP